MTVIVCGVGADRGTLCVTPNAPALSELGGPSRATAHMLSVEEVHVAGPRRCPRRAQAARVRQNASQLQAGTRASRGVWTAIAHGAKQPRARCRQQRRVRPLSDRWGHASGRTHAHLRKHRSRSAQAHSGDCRANSAFRRLQDRFERSSRGGGAPVHWPRWCSPLEVDAALRTAQLARFSAVSVSAMVRRSGRQHQEPPVPARRSFDPHDRGPPFWRDRLDHGHEDQPEWGV